MEYQITGWQPEKLFHFFEEISAIPRGSGNEKGISDYLVEFAKKRGLWVHQDGAWNVIIKKAGSPGAEDCAPVMLQGHLDMVCEKNAGVEHDFTKEGLKLTVKDGVLTADGTTLGADNGVAIALMLTVLDDETLVHPPVECVFTTEEEVGLNGAAALDKSLITARTMINMDSEDEGIGTVSCAGGLRIECARPIQREAAKGTLLRLAIGGLKGGHSGGDIHLGHANANKLLTRFLTQCADKYDLYLCQIDGGNLRNAIPREAHALIALPEADKHALRTDLNIFAAEVQDEYHVTDPDMELTLESEPFQPRAIDRDTTQRLLQALYACPHGVYAMSQDIPGLVETSTNLASVKMRPGNVIRIETSQRSSTASAKQDIARMVRTVFRMAGATVTFGEGYPGWKPNTHSEILEVATESYRRLFGTEAKVKAIHAGLECGLFLDKYPALDMLSFGPTLQGVHSPDERMLIPSVQRFWDHLVDILKHTPVKK